MILFSFLGLILIIAGTIIVVKSNKSNEQLAGSETEKNGEVPSNDKETGEAVTDKKSKWTGGGMSAFTLHLVNFFIILCTLGFLYPVAYVRSLRYDVEHRIIDGKRLRFDGTAGELTGKWIVWLLLCIVTIGIYAFFVSKRLKCWQCEHTHFIDE